MPEIETEVRTVFRAMLRDVVACSDYHEVCHLLGLVPASPDVDEVEHDQSHARIAGFMPVAAQTLLHADIASSVLYRLIQLDDSDEEDEPYARAVLDVIARTACSTVISHLLEQGTLEIGRNGELP
ncbi:hypothetical protein ACF06W_11660 [Streptomyces albus]|uniref:hypothetical protein n=1 Tax=Streptomyces albus TaxID=1888 RepID=UPI0036F98D39